jgi:hypothetical protein
MDITDEGYIGTDPIYQNHAYDTLAPMASEDPVEAYAEAVAADWEAALPVKSVDTRLDATPASSLQYTEDQSRFDATVNGPAEPVEPEEPVEPDDDPVDASSSGSFSSGAEASSFSSGASDSSSINTESSGS